MVYLTIGVILFVLISRFIFVLNIFEIMKVPLIFCLFCYLFLLSKSMTKNIIWLYIFYESCISRNKFLLLLNIGYRFHILYNLIIFHYMGYISWIKRHKLFRSFKILMFLIYNWILRLISFVANNCILDLFFFFIYWVALNLWNFK